MYELLIQNDSTVFQPAVEGLVKWETSRKGRPGKLTFSVVVDDVIRIQEGNAVRLMAGAEKLFYGFVFTKSLQKNGLMKITAYDQLRYLKNKDTYIYSNKTAGELILMIAEDFQLQVGSLADTDFKIGSRKEINKSLLEMVLNALDLTLQGTGKMFVLFDDFGKLMLKNVEDMQLSLLIDDEAGENFSYGSSIDGETYNKIKLSYDNEKTGKQEIYIAQDSSRINDWGVLQFFDSLDNPENGKAKADALLKLYNQKKRSLKITNAFGDVTVRGGSSIPVYLDLKDTVVKNYMIVEEVVHTFGKDTHTMNLTLRGGVINA